MRPGVGDEVAWSGAPRDKRIYNTKAKQNGWILAKQNIYCNATCSMLVFQITPLLSLKCPHRG